MVKAGHIRGKPPGAGLDGGTKTMHVGHEIAPIDTVFALIQENPKLGRTWAPYATANVSHFGVNAVRIDPRVASVPSKESSEVKIHGHGPAARFVLPIDDYIRMVGRALIDSRAL